MAHVPLLKKVFSALGRHIHMQQSTLQYIAHTSYARTVPNVFNFARHNSDHYNRPTFRQITNESKPVIKGRESDDKNVLQTLEEGVPESPDREYMLPSQKKKEYYDLLLKKISSSNTADDLWEIYEKHSDVMDVRHLLRILHTLSILVAKGYEECSIIHENEIFQDVCLRTFKSSRRMEVVDLVYLLQYLCRLEVPPQSKMVQTILQLLRHSINDMDLRLVIRLEFLLKKLPLTPLSHGMLMAIPPIMEILLAQEPLSSLSLKQLSQTLSICVSGKVRNMGLILQELYKRGNIHSASMTQMLLWSLVEMYCQKGKPAYLSKEDAFTREVLLKECLAAFSKNLDMFKINQIETALSKICLAYENQDIHSYNEHFLNSVAHNVLQRKVDFTKISHINRRLLKMNFLSEDLVKYVVSTAVQYPEEVLNAHCPMGPLITAIISSPNYDEKHEETIRVMLKHSSLSISLDESFRVPVLNLTLDLLNVGYYHEPYLELLTSREYLNQYVEKFPLGNVTSKQLLQLNQVLTLLEKSQRRVPDEFLVDARVLKRELVPTETALYSKLQQVLADPDMIVSGVITENDLYFHHLIVIDDEGYPIKVAEGDQASEEITRINDLNIPKNTRKIAIMDIRAIDTYGPKNVLKRYVQLDRQLLEASGCVVVPILQSVISQLAIDERNLYIKSLLDKAGVVF